MKKEIVVIDKINKIVRVTTIDERWYAKPSENKKTGLPEYKFYPSSTWIASYYYTSPYLIKWIANRGLEEAEVIKIAAGDKGSKIHQATELLDKGQELKIGEMLINPTTNLPEAINGDEWEVITSYYNWFIETKPEILATEMTVFNEEYQYAGTLDRIMRINGEIYIVDLKTSKSIQETHIIQVASYKHADIDYKSLNIKDKEWENRKIAILQIGYRLNKNGYKFTEVEDKFNLFLNSMEIWKNENPDTKPRQKDFPLSLKIK